MKTRMALTLLISRLAPSSAFAPARSLSLARATSVSISGGLGPLNDARPRPFSSTNLSMAKRVLVPIADDSEEIETTCITDTLVRFGAEVVVASVKPGGELVCKMSRGVKVRHWSAV